MAKCHRNNVDPLILHRIPSASSSSTSLNSFSRSTFRRLILDAISCGGSSRHQRELQQDEDKTTIGGDDLATKSEKLCDLLNLTKMETKKEETLEILKRVAKDLQAEETEREKKVMAASEVRLLAKDDAEARVTLAMLGAIPPLVSMIDDSQNEDDLIASLYALLNLAIGNDANKEAIVRGGAVHKMLKLIESSKPPPNQAISEAIVANFLGLSALDSNKPIIGSSGAIIFLARALKTSSSQAREDALRALYNLSIHHQNVSFILETDLVPFLLNALGDMEVSERILSVLTNVVSVSEGRKAVGEAVEAFPILVDVLNWNDSEKCQEKAVYILMLMAHKGYGGRRAMIEAGIESSLLELTLVGSPLVQRRASRILESLRAVDKGKQVSAPIYGITCSSSSSSLSRERNREIRMSDERRAVQQLVQQSLQSNMKRIVKRANFPQDFVTTSQHFTKSLTF
ncbi:PREDICTED: U-box domain-containing protein 7 [Brassica oleracea var. oleracea]|uniref:U-box domain-containing protein n=1 Tax=Brassica oleracea var. oleracea TaxID=109376 RepID=A0A0D3DVI6_BRAOL|nr:PREDICTED: U-box domain-containing protein 7 [Brassica oleracea var. oleracea]